MKNKKTYLIIGIIFLIIFIIFTTIIKFVDVKNIGPHNTSVGLSTINNFFANKIGFHNKIYQLTEILGIIPVIIVLFYAIIGFYSLIKEKSFKKVNNNLYYLAIFYIIVLGIYVLFEKVIINFRPVIIEGILESSYPSSHTILAICICGSSIMLNNAIFKNNKIAKLENIISFIIMILLPLLRFISGVHWFTDIIGGILLSLSLLMFFKYFVK
ncbi:MAG: phosphatase PAP2 family protein [Bacilli bacterium]